MRRHILWCTALLASLGVIGCAEPPATEPVARGRQVYRALDCGRCHQVAERGGRSGPDLSRIGTVAGERRPGDPAGYLRESVLDPGAYVVPGFPDTMPRGLVRNLSPDDLEALIAYLSAQR